MSDALDRLAFTPGGAQTISKMAWNFPDNYPRVIEQARGCTLTDIDGRNWIDWTMGLASVGIGYGDGRVTQAVYEAAWRGPACTFPTVSEGLLAEQLCDLIPCAEQVRFLKTGSEAAEAAIRVARAATGRDVILTSGYHSWHSWYAATREDHPGVPRSMTRLVQSFTYNDLQSLDDAVTLSQFDGKDVAAIFLEPTLIESPVPGFLEGCRKKADELRCPLIFDEVVTGFRWSTGGYQEVCGVIPDLATFGKAMGNGVPVAALVGRRAVMEHAWLASGTHNGDQLGLAAALAVLKVYREEATCQRLALWGAHLMGGLREAAARHPAAGLVVRGQPPHPVLSFQDDPDRRKLTLFLREMADGGVLIAPYGINPCAAHEDVVILTLSVAEAALETVEIAVNLDDLAALVPVPIRAGWRPTA